jgi:hypothetical protein
VTNVCLLFPVLLYATLCAAVQVGCRMKPNEHYMDYTGSSVYCQSQIDQVRPCVLHP